MFRGLASDVEDLVDEAIHLSYYMRGGIPYEQMLMRTPGERQRIATFVEKKLDQVSKMPQMMFL